MRVYVPSAALLAPLAVGLILTGSAFGEDTAPPELKSPGLTPASIDTSSSAMEVTVNFTVTDDASGANYFETTFLDRSGTGRHSASCRKVRKMAWVRQTENSFEANPGHSSPSVSTNRLNLNYRRSIL